MNYLVRGLGFVLLASWLAAAYAGAEDAAFETRFDAALTRFAYYGDVHGLGGASVGSIFGTSTNPASQAWNELDGSANLVSPQYNAIRFDNDVGVNAYVLATQLETESFGNVAPAVLYADTGDSVLDDGSELDLSTYFVQYAWSAKVNSEWAIGLTAGAGESKTEFGFLGQTVSTTRETDIGATLGVLRELSEELHWGGTVSLGYGRVRSTTFDVAGLGIGTVKRNDDSYSIDARTGVSYGALDSFWLYADYQLAWFDGDRQSSLTVHRLYAGADIPLTASFYTRFGGVVDQDGEFTPSAGIGIYPSDRFGIDIAVRDNMFPEINRELGESTFINLSLFYIFGPDG